MILVDTSIWVDHLRKVDDILQYLLIEEKVISHPFIITELALGFVPNRKETFIFLRKLARAITVEDEEILEFIEKNNLNGSGIGFVDAHLLASALLMGASLWTRDKRLHQIAVNLGVGFKLDKLTH